MSLAIVTSRESEHGEIKMVDQQWPSQTFFLDDQADNSKQDNKKKTIETR